MLDRIKILLGYKVIYIPLFSNLIKFITYYLSFYNQVVQSTILKTESNWLVQPIESGISQVSGPIKLKKSVVWKPILNWPNRLRTSKSAKHDRFLPLGQFSFLKKIKCNNYYLIINIEINNFIMMKKAKKTLWLDKPMITKSLTLWS